MATMTEPEQLAYLRHALDAVNAENERLRADLSLVTKERDSALHWLNNMNLFNTTRMTPTMYGILRSAHAQNCALIRNTTHVNAAKVLERKGLIKLYPSEDEDGAWLVMLTDAGRKEIA